MWNRYRQAAMAMLFAVPGCAATPARDAAAGVVVMPAPSILVPVAPAPEFMALGSPVIGYASWYRRSRVHHRTCTGQLLDDNALSAASPTLPMGTTARVNLLGGDRSVTVTVNDCMPPGRRIIDLSAKAARQLGMAGMGIAEVSVTPVLGADE